MTTTTQTTDRLYMPNLSSFKTCSLLLGLLVGTFIYLSTLGAEFVGVMVWGREVLTKSQTDLILFSLAWNVGTTILALLVLTTLRRMIVAVMESTLRSDNAEDIVFELLSYLEARFAVGALAGICFTWNVTNFVLGMRPQIVQSCIILVVACLWCRMTLCLVGGSNQELVYEEEEEEETEDDKTEPLLRLV